ncbi:hypothetical protein JOD57_003160 [Geodermatophilus bullaregiensis]|uniref:hypothetical protein n=1 Tax=Geodermatophilus bullaregiensis TaxID=1564160 RepID=UPI00195F0780|nr:hypothetical protein [Geodermatophilus bullaregiensis]MBM7807323.1 hypothetical protein [Geodermatophilus bullaregiensis]
MYTRSTTFRGDPTAIDDGIAYVRDEVMPAVQRMDGCVGLSMLVDRHTGRCIVTTSWVDPESMHRSAEAVRSVREKAIRTVRGTDDEIEVAEWSVAVLHRVREAPRGAATRVMWTKGPIGRMDRIVDAFRRNIAPRVDDLPGFCSVSLLVDHGTGRCATAATYDSRQTMNRARGQAQAMREEFTEHMGMRVTEVAEFDLVLAHLRVPETV